MADETMPSEEITPEPTPVDASAEETPTVDAVPAETPTDPVTEATPAEPVPEPPTVEDVPEEPPAGPIVTDPVLPDVPVDSVFATPIELLDPPAAAVLAEMPDADKEELQTLYITNAWNGREHFECQVPGCAYDSLSEAAMVSHVATEHAPANASAPAGAVPLYDRYGAIIGYRGV